MSTLLLIGIGNLQANYFLDYDTLNKFEDFKKIKNACKFADKLYYYDTYHHLGVDYMSFFFNLSNIVSKIKKSYFHNFTIIDFLYTYKNTENYIIFLGCINFGYLTGQRIKEFFNFEEMEKKNNFGLKKEDIDAILMIIEDITLEPGEVNFATNDEISKANFYEHAALKSIYNLHLPYDLYVLRIGIGTPEDSMILSEYLTQKISLEKKRLIYSAATKAKVTELLKKVFDRIVAHD